MRRHDEDLVGPPLLQRLCRRHEAVHVVDDVILQDKRRHGDLFENVMKLNDLCESHHYDGDAAPNVSHHGDRWLLFGDQHCGQRSTFPLSNGGSHSWGRSGLETELYVGSPCWGGWLPWS